MINFECREINVFVLPNGQFYIQNLMLNTIIQIILIKSSAVLRTLFHLIDLDLRCSPAHLKQVYHAVVVLNPKLQITISCAVNYTLA